MLNTSPENLPEATPNNLLENLTPDALFGFNWFTLTICVLVIILAWLLGSYHNWLQLNKNVDIKEDIKEQRQNHGFASAQERLLFFAIFALFFTIFALLLLLFRYLFQTLKTIPWSLKIFSTKIMSSCLELFVGIFFFSFLVYVLTDIAHNLQISFFVLLSYIFVYSVFIPVAMYYIRYFIFFLSALINLPFEPDDFVGGAKCFYDFPNILQHFIAWVIAVLLLIKLWV